MNRYDHGEEGEEEGCADERKLHSIANQVEVEYPIHLEEQDLDHLLVLAQSREVLITP